MADLSSLKDLAPAQDSAPVHVRKVDALGREVRHELLRQTGCGQASIDDEQPHNEEDEFAIYFV